MKQIPLEDLIVRDSFLLPFRGSEIWALELDALSTHTALAMEKFQQDIKYAQRPSTTSSVAVHLRDTLLTPGFIQAIAGGLAGGRGNIRRVAFVGVGRDVKDTLRTTLQSKASGIAIHFFDNYEKAKEWLVP